jgi:hypothetical protein
MNIPTTVSDIMLTPLQAFKAMAIFLDEYYWLTKSDDLGGLLGAMSFDIFGDGTQTADPAIWDDWIDCLAGKDHLTIQEAYKSIIIFVSEQFSPQPDEHVAALVEGMQFSSDNKPINSLLWQQWCDAVEKVLKSQG